MSPRTYPLALSLVALALASPATRCQVLLYELASANEELRGHFGAAVAGVPDADGDGRDDVLIGAPDELESAGRAYVFGGADGTLLYTLASPNIEVYGQFGLAVAGVDDVDGDGRGDLLVGAPTESAAGALYQAGRVYIFSGATGELLREIVSPNAEEGSLFGLAVAAVPDLDGDGRGDLLVGARGEGPGPSPAGAGRAYAISGATGALLHTLASPNEEYSGGFGVAVAHADDVDGDGVTDLIVGAPFEDAGPLPRYAGRAYVFSGATGARLGTLRSPNPTEDGFFGREVAGGGDLDGDGRAEVLVSATEERRTYVFSGASGTVLHTVTGSFAVAGVPDANGDGVRDLLVGDLQAGGPFHAGSVIAYSGSTGATLRHLYSPNAEDSGLFGTAVAGMEDADGSGRGAFLIGALNESPGSSPLEAGRAYVFSGTLVLTISAHALNSPVPRGGRLRFEVTLANHAAAPLSGDLGLDVAGPDGTTYERLLEEGRTLAGNTTRTLDYARPVPADAALGTYTATVTARKGGTTPFDAAVFTFEVVAAEGTLATAGAGVVVPAVASPNPAADQAAVSFVLGTAADVRLALYDALGREVAAVAAGLMKAGQHRLALDLSALPAGAYVWRLSTGGRVETGRLTVVR
jgi:hypothetical protein